MYPGGVSASQGNAEYRQVVCKTSGPSEVLIQNNKMISRKNFGDDYHCFLFEGGSTRITHLKS
jgi:hypothetical protein